MREFRSVATVFFLLFSALQALGQQPGRLRAVVLDDLNRHGEVFFSTRLADPSALRRLSSLVSVDKVEGDLVWAYANQRELEAMIANGFDYQWIKHPFPENPLMLETLADGQVLAWDFYPTYAIYLDMMSQFQADYPALCRIDTIGVLPSGRMLLSACISDQVNLDEDEPAVLYTAAMHGNELTSYVLMLRLIDHLLVNYGSDSLVTRLVNKVEIHINPLANPDGTFHGGNHTIGGAIRYNANGVDLNRNYPDFLSGPHPDGNAWQPETVAFMAFAGEHDFNLAINFHGGIEVFNYPWDTWSVLAADDAWWIQIARAYVDTVHLYSPATYFDDLDNGITNGYAWYEVNGSRQDYMNYYRHCREATLEISTQKTPAASTLPTYWNYNKRSLLNLIGESLNGIRGLVRDSLTNQGLKAMLSIPGHDQDSSQVYSSLPCANYYRYLYPGVYDLHVTAPGYVPKTINQVVVGQDSCTVLDVALRPCGTSISGDIRYDNSGQTPVQGVAVTLVSGVGDTLAVDTTDVMGLFIFANLLPATYHLHFSTPLAVGGINSSDALLILRHFVHLDQLTGTRAQAGDVDLSGNINSIDALMVQRKFVGLLGSFPADPWLFPQTAIVLDANTPALNIVTICSGDVNGSFVP